MLSFPVLEAVGIFWVADKIGAWVLLWLLLAVIAGVTLIRFERVAWGARMAFTMQSGVNPMSSLLASGRILLAGGLLVFPGFISDVIAVVLLLIPGTWDKRKTDPLRPANDDAPSTTWEQPSNVAPKTIDGEFKREPDDLQR
ncbi:MAG: FxsA family protein [Thiobacillus sp.]|nr:FxsA family protein [Thiobacillus sp.]